MRQQTNRWIKYYIINCKEKLSYVDVPPMNLPVYIKLVLDMLVPAANSEWPREAKVTNIINPNVKLEFGLINMPAMRGVIIFGKK